VVTEVAYHSDRTHRKEDGDALPLCLLISPRQRESSLSQGAKWKALINTYIGTIPVSGDPSRAAEQSISGMLSPWTAVSSAMIAKVGVAASDSNQAALAGVRFLRLLATCESTKSIMSEIISVHLHCVLLQY
jgi:hypothetical protein